MLYICVCNKLKAKDHEKKYMDNRAVFFLSSGV